MPMFPYTLESLGAILLTLTFAFLFVFCRKLLQSWKPPLPYPPGPPPRNLLSGNADDIPSSKPWLTYTDWGKLYGDVVHFRIYGQHTIILNSMEAVKELLEKRSGIYSSRPHVEMVDLMGWDFNVGLKPYGEDWRMHRRLYQQSFRPASSPMFRPIITTKVNDLLYYLLEDPDNFSSHYKTFSTAVIMAIVYGHNVVSKDDKYISIVNTAMDRLTASFFPGASPVNALPILKYLPEWFPGAGFQRFAKSTRQYTTQMQDLPLNDVKMKMVGASSQWDEPEIFDQTLPLQASGTALPCVASELLSDFPSQENAIKAVCATVYAAGSDTSETTLATFFITMAMNPAIQKKAQKEIDDVVGPGKLVNFEEHEKALPYIHALCREIMRWRPALPLGVTHSTTVEDIYKGYYIPKDANVIANTWALSHDPTKYKDPETFNPDRFLDAQGKLLNNIDTYGFGFGRRICPGRHMALDSLWLSVASILSVFDIGLKKDDLGNDIPIVPEYTDSLISHPLPFKCSVTPRSKFAKRVILQAVGRDT